MAMRRLARMLAEVLYIGDRLRDLRKRKVIYDRKYKEVEKKLAEARGDAARGIVFDAKGQTVAEFLTRWLEDVVKPNKTHRTYATHRQQVHSHIIPSIGRV